MAPSKPVPRSKTRRKKRIPGSPGATARERIRKLNEEKALIGTDVQRAGKHNWTKYTGGPLKPGDKTYDKKRKSMREQRKLNTKGATRGR